MSCFKLYSNLQNKNRYLVRIRVDIRSTSHSSPFPRKRQNPDYSLICYQHQSGMKPLFSGMSMSSDFSFPRCRNTFQSFHWAPGSPTGWQLEGISYPWREAKQTHSRDLSKKILNNLFFSTTSTLSLFTPWPKGSIVPEPVLSTIFYSLGLSVTYTYVYISFPFAIHWQYKGYFPFSKPTQKQKYYQHKCKIQWTSTCLQIFFFFFLKTR